MTMTLKSETSQDDASQHGKVWHSNDASQNGVLTTELVLARSRAANLKSVKKLNIWHNQIADISLAKSLTCLQVLNLSTNHVTSLRPLMHCGSLQELYLRKNRIASSTELVFLAHLPDLTSLWLAGNPFCDEFDSSRDYRRFVITTLPQVTTLDNVAITAEERQQAAEAAQIQDSSTILNENKQLENLKGDSKEDVSLTQDYNISPPEIDLSQVVLPPNLMEKTEGDFSGDEDDDDDDGAEMKDDVDDESSSLDEDEVLKASLRFSLVETNSIRESLGLDPISSLETEEDITVRDVHDDDDDDDDDDDTLDDGDDEVDDVLNSYADILDEEDERFDSNDDVDMNQMDDSNDGFDFGAHPAEQKTNRKVKIDARKDYRESEVESNAKSNVETATLLLLTNLDKNGLKRVMKECHDLLRTLEEEEEEDTII